MFKKAATCIKNNKFYFFGFLVLAIVLIANIFPRGYVFCGGDTAQFIEAKNNFYSLFYNWKGKTIFYYGIFYILDYFGLSDSGQLSWYLGIFIVSSYISFGIFSRLLFKISDKIRFLTSLFYALNLYTLFLFAGNLSFSYYPSLYIFIPVLSGLFIKFLFTRNNLYGVLFVFVTLLGSSGFGNVAFLLSFFLFLLLVTIFFIFAKIINFDRQLIIKLIILGLISFLINAFWILPVIPEMRGEVEKLQASDVLEFNYIIRHTASPILNIISMIYSSGDYFPNNFPYKNLGFLKQAFFVLAFLPIIIISIGLANIKKIDGKSRKMFLAFGGILLVMTIFIARVTEPFRIINHYIYSIWGMETLRGFDKTAIFFPFILTTLLLMILTKFESKKWLMGAMFIVLLLPLPFYTGKIQQNMSYRFSNASPENKDFQKSKLSFLVKIPNEYYRIRKIINSDQEKAFIATLPYTANDGSGISNYPKWKMYGIDITQYLYNKNLMVANVEYFPGWNFSQMFSSENNSSDQWLVKLLGMMNAKYIIYHKDAPEESMANSSAKMKKLEQEGMISNLEDNDYFTLYEIKKEYVLPHLSWQNENIEVTSDLQRMDSKLESIRNGFQPAQFKEINPKKFEVNLKKNAPRQILVLAEQYDSNWKAYAVSKGGKEKEITDHRIARGYANGWVIPQNTEVDRILVEYYPVRLMMRWIWISLATALFLLAYLVIYYYGKNKISPKNNA